MSKDQLPVVIFRRQEVHFWEFYQFNGSLFVLKGFFDVQETSYASHRVTVLFPIRQRKAHLKVLFHPEEPTALSQKRTYKAKYATYCAKGCPMPVEVEIFDG